MDFQDLKALVWLDIFIVIEESTRRRFSCDNFPFLLWIRIENMSAEEDK